MTDNNEPMNLSEEEIIALRELINDKLWWNEAGKRIKRISLIAGAIFAGLSMLAMWWPWITRIVQFFIKDIPTG